MERSVDPAASAQANYAVQLRWFRSQRQMTQAKLGELPEIMVSGKTIEAVENMRRPPTRRLSAGVDEVFNTELFKALYASYLRESGLPPGYVEYTEFEERASRINVYSQYCLHGLVQTKACATEVLRMGQRKEVLHEVVAARLARQEALRREPPPAYTALIDEAVIRKLVAIDSQVATEQISYLLELSEEPHITIQVVPFSAKVYPESGLTVLSFDDEPPVGYLESAGGYGMLLEPGPEVTGLATLFDRIRGFGLTTPDSRTWLHSILREL